eukprot:scaffold33355_cov36-Attheya_sp.AAC.5
MQRPRPLPVTAFRQALPMTALRPFSIYASRSPSAPPFVSTAYALVDAPQSLNEIEPYPPAYSADYNIQIYGHPQIRNNNYAPLVSPTQTHYAC